MKRSLILLAIVFLLASPLLTGCSSEPAAVAPKIEEKNDLKELNMDNAEKQLDMVE